MKLKVKHIGKDFTFKKSSPRHVAEHDKMKTDLGSFISRGMKDKSLLKAKR